MLQQFFITINEWMAGGTIVAAAGCFIWGMVSVLLSPCHMASIPLIVGYVGGQQQALNPKQAGAYSVAFTTGLFITIALIGIICALLGRMLGDVGNAWHILIGAILIWAALGMLGVEKCSMSGSLLYRLNFRGLFGAFILGLAYGVLSGSCTFGFIAPILAIITIQQKVITGIVLEKMVDIRGGIPLIVTSFIGAPLGAYFTKMVSTDVLIMLFAVSMLFAGGKMLISSGQPEKTEMMPARKRMIYMGVGGFFIGFIAGLLGVGGGFLFVPMMIGMGYETKTAAATSAFVVIFSSFSGFAGHIAEGHFNWPLMVTTSIAVIIGSQIGAKVMKEKMKAKWIKQMFAVVLLGVAFKLIWKWVA